MQIQIKNPPLNAGKIAEMKHLAKINPMNKMDPPNNRQNGPRIG